MCLHGCTITTETKINVFEIFSHSTGPFGVAPFEKISKNVDFSLRGKHCVGWPVKLCTFSRIFLMKSDFTIFLHFFADFRALWTVQICYGTILRARSKESEGPSGREQIRLNPFFEHVLFRWCQYIFFRIRQTSMSDGLLLNGNESFKGI